MTNLQVELAKAKKRIEKAVRKHIDCKWISVSFDH